jgi:hypothetical protein
MTTTPKFGIPLISSQQSQPEVTHNQMVVLLQALAGGAKEERSSPPVSPAAGDCYIISGTPSGAWVGHTHAIAIYYGGWNYVPGFDDDGVVIPMTAAQNGLSIFNNATGELWAWQTSSWIVVTGGTGASRLIDLLDVLVSETASENGDYLVWDDASGKWVNRNPPRLVDLSDVAASETSTIDGDFLAWDDAAQKWVPTPINLPSDSTPALMDLPDVHVGESALEDGDYLSWNNAIQKWVARPTAFASSILASASILVGSGANVATARAMSGDATLSNFGVISVTKSGGVAFGSAAFASTAAFDAAGAAAAALVTAENYADTGDTAIRALRAATGVFGLAKVDGTTILSTAGVLSWIKPTAPTMTKLTAAASGNYNPPAGCTRIEVELKGGGGGTSGSGTAPGNGTAGADAVFNGYHASGGGTGGAGNFPGIGGSAGANGSGAAWATSLPGAGGGPFSMVPWSSTTFGCYGGTGGGKGGGRSGLNTTAAQAGAANSGGGGGAAGFGPDTQANITANDAVFCGGGGEGETRWLQFNAPVGPIAYVVPAGGTAGAAGSAGGQPGAAGGTGYIYIKEFYD